jgi:hypothetical protein
VNVKKINKKLSLITLFSLFGIIMWYFTPRTGGGRFILPYLPALSLLAAYTISIIKNKYVYFTCTVAIIIIAITSIGYRATANSKYLPVILGKEPKEQFLANHLNFSFGDFYDTDGYFAKHIKKTDTVLLVGFHNLYYVNFPFIDSSWVTSKDTYNYIAVQHGLLKQTNDTWKLVHINYVTDVRVYTLQDKH